MKWDSVRVTSDSVVITGGEEKQHMAVDQFLLLLTTIQG